MVIQTVINHKIKILTSTSTLMLAGGWVDAKLCPFVHVTTDNQTRNYLLHLTNELQSPLLGMKRPLKRDNRAGKVQSLGLYCCEKCGHVVKT